MNFKKYHVSKNLYPLDVNKLHVGRIENDGTIDYEVGTLTVGTDSVSYEANTTWRGFYTDFIQSNENEKLTFNSNNSSNIAISCDCYDESNNFLGKVTGQWQTSSVKVFSLLTGTKKVRMDVTSSSTVYTISQPMLNTGSEPLPYEPYNTEVWHDIPYYIHKTATDTITTLPADLYADGNNATVGLVGNMSQTGTPTPSNPIQPQETGERTGNLFDISEAIDTKMYINNNGNLVEGTDGDRFIAFELAVTPSSDYTFSWSRTVWGTGSNSPYIRIAQYDALGNFISRVAYKCSNYSDKIISITVSNNTAKLDIRYDSSTSTRGQTITDLMINTGSTALPHEPYGIKIPISSANITTPVYLGEVETTRKIKKLVLTGDESWRMGNYPKPDSYQFYIPKSVSFPDAKSTIVAGESFCTHFISQETIGGIAWGTNFNVYMPISDLPENATADDFKTYLQQQYANGTPVVVYYVLATEETGIVNEPLRKIGDYADTVSGITIPTITGKDTFDVLTTLKPSEVTVNYHGWHTGTVHERESGSWD